VEVQLHAFLTSVLDKDEWSTSAWELNSQKTASGEHSAGSCAPANAGRTGKPLSLLQTEIQSSSL